MIGKTLTGLALAAIAACTVLAFTTNHSYVTTPSMYPTIPPGSEVFVSAEPSYHVGDVIEFRGNGLVWAHRLIKINPDGTLVTKGDNPQNSPDVFVPALTRKDVIGKVTLAPRWLGFPELIWHHPGYGLSWLRAELGLTGRIGFVAVVALLALLAATGFRPLTGLRRRRDERDGAEARGRHRLPEGGSPATGHEATDSGTGFGTAGTAGTAPRHRQDRDGRHTADIPVRSPAQGHRSPVGVERVVRPPAHGRGW